MNLDEFRNRVARAIGMSTEDTGDLALIDGWVNEGTVQFLDRTKANVLTASLLTTAGVGDYTLDTDIMSFTDAWYSQSGGNQDMVLEQVDSREILRLRRQASSASAPRLFALQGAHLLMLYPAALSSLDTLHILYTPRPSLISDVQHSPEDATRGGVPPEYHPVIEAYAKWKAAEAEEHKPSQFGLAFQAEFEKGCALARSSMNRKSGVFKARKVGGGGGRSRLPMTPGTDLR
jgi:hypothetical protein